MSAESVIFKLEPKGLINIDLFLDVAHLYINGEQHEIRTTGETESPAEGVRVDVIAFIDPVTAQKSDGALISIQPEKSTPPQHMIGSRIFIDAVDGGSGTWVGLSPEGELATFHFEDECQQKAVVHGQGWTSTWIAGERGLKVIEVCTPPFTEGEIEVLKLQDKKTSDGMIIPPSFWTACLGTL